MQSGQKFQGNTFIVTGGTSGLGESTATLLTQLGGNVGILDVNKEKGSEIASKLGKQALFIACDVTDETLVKQAIQKVTETFPAPIRGLINCAGVGCALKLITNQGEPHSLDVFKTVMNINVVGTFNVTRLVVQNMIKQKPDIDGERGVIINVASVAAFDGEQGQTAYSASKGAIVGMTLPLARELGTFGIRVVTIAPGIFKTPMSDPMSERVNKALVSQTCFPQRLGNPEEFAQLCASIIQLSMLNGEVIRLDGGIRLPKL
eukprot:TRINITY_DN5328_c0_g1_i1.p1 TRINITY_DN5328_c0_g1~~TRINITY_DN5328_c0_g1_i1.p1  ORF type:complete len:262 (-),score=41.89 TRINITY_DN5328_c0_g1_i1:103-888(-)